MSQTGIENKTDRVLTIYTRLMNGKTVDKKKTADEFGVNARSVQRDIEDIRAYLANSSDMLGKNCTVIYDHKKKGFRLDDDLKKMSGGEFLAVCKILLESRAFVKEELEPIIEKLIDNCAPSSDQKHATTLIANERFHYIGPHHQTYIIDKLWNIGNAVKNQQYLTIHYEKLGQNHSVVRLVKPVGVMFSEYYFYMIAFIENEHHQDCLSPAIYRIDRIRSLQVMKEHFSVPYKNRFEEGEFRKRVQFMYGGKLQRIVFEYTGISIEAILDKLPTAEILEVKENDNQKIYTIRTEVFGDGIDMWLRGQGDFVKVISRKNLTV